MIYCQVQMPNLGNFQFNVIRYMWIHASNSYSLRYENFQYADVCSKSHGGISCRHWYASIRDCTWIWFNRCRRPKVYLLTFTWMIIFWWLSWCHQRNITPRWTIFSFHKLSWALSWDVRATSGKWFAAVVIYVPPRLGAGILAYSSNCQMLLLIGFTTVSWLVTLNLVYLLSRIIFLAHE